MRPVKKCTHANYIIENVSKFRQKIMNKETRFLLEIHKTFFTGKGYIVCLVIFISVFFVIQISGKQYSSLEKEHDRLYEEYGGKEYGQIISIVQEKEKNVEIKFDDDKIAWYQFNDLDQIEHSYSITIHKAQRKRI